MIPGLKTLQFSQFQFQNLAWSSSCSSPHLCLTFTLAWYPEPILLPQVSRPFIKCSLSPWPLGPTRISSSFIAQLERLLPGEHCCGKLFYCVLLMVRAAKWDHLSHCQPSITKEWAMREWSRAEMANLFPAKVFLSMYSIYSCPRKKLSA